MELFVSAGEASSDIHCAHLIRELKKTAEVTTFGLGGDKLAETGMNLFMHNREFSVGGGPLEVLSKLPKRSQLERMLEKRLFERRPDGAILVDNGEINLRLASLLNFFEVPVVYFIPPKVWVWRPLRIEKIARHVKLVLSILPFEEPIYKEWEIPFRYVGNPLMDEIPMDLTEEKAKAALGLNLKKPVLTVFPGSRHTEIRYHVEVFSEAVKQFLAGLPSSEPKPTVLIPAAQAVDPGHLLSSFQSALPGVEVRVVKGQSHECLKAARAALVKSGTSTLEAGALGVPMVMAYQSSRSAAWVFHHVVRYQGFVALVNLFLGKNPEAALGWAQPEMPVVTELILEKCRPEDISRELLKVYLDGPERTRMLEELKRIPELLKPPQQWGVSPLHAAAQASLEVFQNKGRSSNV